MAVEVPQDARAKLKLKTNVKWFEQRPQFKDPKIGKVPHDVEMNLRREAEDLLATESKHYSSAQNRTSKRTDFNWIRVVLSKGALNDKLAAHTLLIQDSAVHNLSSLQSLVQMVNSKGKREQLTSMDHLKDIFIGDLLYTSKLRPFNELAVNLEEKDLRQRSVQLMLYYFEDQLRMFYRSFVEAVEKISHDTVPTTKTKAINTMYELLASNGEQEQYLLENLVNKLGDPSAKVASHVAHVLRRLVTDNHPAMKEVVVREVERILYRPNITEKAQYYCLCFLQELIFTPRDTALANKLIGIYFGFFKICTTKGDVNNKMMSALLTAVSRALPYSKLGPQILENHMETFYRLIHFVNTNITIQGLTLMFNVLQGESSGSLADRFYSVLYRVILDPQLENCSRLAMFLNLVYRCIKRDASPQRSLAFLRRLLQVAKQSNTAFAASLMIVISESLKEKPHLAACFYQEIDISDVSGDNSSKKVVVNEESASDSSDEEEDNPAEKTTKAKANHGNKKPLGKTADQLKTRTDDYQLNPRNPLYGNAHKTSLWEVPVLCKHYHPSVALFANNVATKKYTAYDGDPLADFTLKHFLDRFVYRNPKTVDNQESAFARQASVFGRLGVKRSNVSTASKEFVTMPENKIPLEERFIYHFLKDRAANKPEEDVADNESVASDEFEALLDRFENDFEKDPDFGTDFKKNKKKLAREMDLDSDDGDGSFEGGEDDEDELNFDDDEDYKAAFGGLEDDMAEALEDDEDVTKHVRRGRSKDASSLFASAEKFAALLDAEENEVGDADSDDEDGGRRQQKKRSVAADESGSESGEEDDDGDEEDADEGKRSQKKEAPVKQAKRKTFAKRSTPGKRFAGKPPQKFGRKRFKSS